MTIPVVVLSNAKDLVLLLKGSQPGYFGQKHELRMTAFVCHPEERSEEGSRGWFNQS
jgi:hypothetical protein